jgi:glutamate synthase (NADPH/NADH) large chain
MLEKHVAETDSAVAARILANWETELAHFVRVLPRDYAAVLSIREKAIAGGVDPDSDTVWEQILEVTRG